MAGHGRGKHAFVQCRLLNVCDRVERNTREHASCAVAGVASVRLTSSHRTAYIGCGAAGGFEEAVLAQPGLERLWMGSRGGFVKLALQHGYRLVPVYGFGETDLGPQAQCCVRGRAKFAGKTRIPMTLPTDLRIRRRPITTVVGAPLQLPVIDKPSRDDVEQWRVRVVRAITELYNKHRGKHGRAGVDLQIMG